jgi:hypothetical protein
LPPRVCCASTLAFAFFGILSRLPWAGAALAAADVAVVVTGGVAARRCPLPLCLDGFCFADLAGELAMPILTAWAKNRNIHKQTHSHLHT